MKKNLIINYIVIALISFIIFESMLLINSILKDDIYKPVKVKIEYVIPDNNFENVNEIKEEECIVEVNEINKVNDDKIKEEIFCDSLEYIVMCMQAEAGNQSDIGKRLVVDCIINRYKTGNYDNYYDVINEKGQFSCVSNGSIYKEIPTEENYKIVKEELDKQLNEEVKFFRTNHYHSFGIPVLKEGAHYFSK